MKVKSSHVKNHFHEAVLKRQITSKDLGIHIPHSHSEVQVTYYVYIIFNVMLINIHFHYKEFDVIDTLHLLNMYVDRGVCGLSESPKVHSGLLGFCCVQGHPYFGPQMTSVQYQCQLSKLQPLMEIDSLGKSLRDFIIFINLFCQNIISRSIKRTWTRMNFPTHCHPQHFMVLLKPRS